MDHISPVSIIQVTSGTQALLQSYGVRSHGSKRFTGGRTSGGKFMHALIHGAGDEHTEAKRRKLTVAERHRICQMLDGGAERCASRYRAGGWVVCNSPS